MGMLKGMYAQAVLWLRLFLQDRMTLLVLAISVLSFLFCMADLNAGADQLSSIPVGFVDLDGSVKSRELSEKLVLLPSLSVQYGTYEELEELMLSGSIRCILEVKEGYEKKLYAGKSHNLLNVYYEEDDRVATIVTDIVAGEMMYDLCQAQAYLAYEELPAGEKEKFGREEYEAYAASLVGGEDFDFAFEFHFLDGGQQERKTGIKNSLFYRQAVAAVAALLFTLLMLSALSGVCMEKEQKIDKRKRLAGMGKTEEFLGSMLACTFLSMLPAAVFAVCVAASVGEWKKFFLIFWTSVLFSVMMALVYYILAKKMPDLFAYQVTGTAVLLGFGICSFCFMVDGILFPQFPGWFRLIPNCAYLGRFIEILTT